MTAPAESSVHVAVIGGGIIGLAIAWECTRRGHRVTLIDPAPAQGATYAAAGMLAAVSELHYQEEDLLTLTRSSAALYPEFVAALEAESGLRTRYLATGTLVAGLDAADRQALADLKEAQAAQGLAVEELTVREARRAEPLLGPQLSGVFRMPDDHQVDPRFLAAALLAALESSPHAAVVHSAAEGLTSGGRGRITGVRLAGGGTIEADEVVVANGLGASGLEGLPAGLVLPLRPVYGDILRLAVPEHLRPLATSTLRAVIRGFPVYVVPREDGTVVIGATQREDGSAAVSAGGVYELLRDAQLLLPAVAELELLEAVCRARPGTPDNAPLLGRAAAGCGSGTDGPEAATVPGLVIATGFFRHGVLLAPVAASICAGLVGGRPGEPEHARFRPDRFSGPPARTPLRGPSRSASTPDPTTGVKS